MAKLTTEQRNNLSDNDFALPEKRKWPIPDKGHAIAALTRIEYALKKGWVTQKEHDVVVKKAKEVLEREKEKKEKKMTDSFFEKHRDKVIAVVGLAATAIIGFTSHFEGNKYKAYRDPGGVWTICRGHTKDVTPGMVADEKQCKEWFLQDMQPGMLRAVSQTPTLVDNVNVLYAVGDLIFNSGPGAYSKSPMKMYFDQGDFVKGCNAFRNYYVRVHATKIISSDCKFDFSTKKYFCKLNGLVERREKEAQLCLGEITVDYFSTGK